MSLKEVKFRIGDREFVVKAPLTLGQAEDLDIAVSGAVLSDPVAETKRALKQRREILLAVLKPDYQDLTMEALTMMRAPRAEWKAAVEAILDLSELVKKGDPTPGEAEAEAA